ncbi:MAG: hypothetical protein NC433_01765 [Clostridiales bacterium]|nr:hypothetical protein [Clostridiales bacterium]
MLFFAIELDEERIKKDGIINLDAAYRTIDNTFLQDDIILHHKKDNVRFYTRNIDRHDFEYLWMNNDALREERWFGYYVKTWKYLDIDDESKEIYAEEDLLEGWLQRPDKL